MRAFNNYSKNFWLFLAVVTVIRLLVIGAFGPAPQESYYWNYSKHLDLSYFDHPPMTAYLIYIFTGIFGDNAFGIHFSAVFISIALSLLLFYFVRSLFDEKIAFWTAVAGSTTFIFALGSIIITPDGTLLLFWLLTMISLYQSAKTDDNWWWLLTGIFSGAAFISKYTAVLAIAGAFFYLALSRLRRRHFMSPGPYIAIAAAIVVSMPVFIWNYQHDWASFGFQTGRRAAEVVALRVDYFFGFIGSQIGVLGVFLMPLYIWGLTKAYRGAKDDPRLALFFWFAIPTLALFIIISPFIYVKMNWLAPAYLSGFPAALYYYSKSRKRSLKIYGVFALTFSISVTIAVHILFLLPGIGIGRVDPINGWKELAERVDKIKTGFDNRTDLFICGYEYKTASQLRYYLDGQPEVVSNNIVGRVGLAYDYWSDPDTLVGRNCIFVYDERNRYKGPRPLGELFERVEGPEVLSVAKSGKKITDFYIYKCYRYKGVI